MTAGYHLAVLGDHLGGLAAAALAAHQGRRVLLLETAAAGAPRPFEQLNSFSGSPEHEPGLARLFQDLGLAPYGPLGDEWIHFHALAPPLQICLPRHRLSLHAERTARAFELQREFGDTHRSLSPLWQQEEELRGRLERAAPNPGAPTAGLPMRALAGLSGLLRLQVLEREMSRTGFLGWLREQGLSPELVAALAAQAQAVARRPAAGLNWAEGLRALRVANGGLFRNAAGQTGILAGLRAVFQARGGDARPLVALEGIDLPRSGGARLHLAAGGDLKVDRVIFDLPLTEALRQIPAERAQALTRKGLEEREQWEYGLLEFAIAPERRPEAMGSYLVIASEEAHGGAGVLLAVRAAGAAEDGPCALEALGFFPPGGGAAGCEHLIARVRTVLPFYDESLVGEPLYRTGPAPRFTQERLDRGWRSERLGSGWRTALFSLAPFTFLRNEEYAAVGLTEALLSGALAIS